MRRSIGYLSAALAVIALAGCGSSESESTTTAATTTLVESADSVPAPETSAATPEPSVPDMVWRRATHQESLAGGFMNAVTVAGDRLVAVGGAPGTYLGYTDAAVWISENGLDWERVTSESFTGTPDAFGTEGTQVMHDVVQSGPGVVAVGYDGGPRTGADAAVWTSGDGELWERVPDLSGALGGDGDQVMKRVLAVDGRLVAVGSSSRRPAVWVSTDGAAWEVAGGFDGAQPGALTDVCAFGDLLVAVGYAGGEDVERLGVWLSGGASPLQPAIWISADGSWWSEISQTSDAAPPETDSDWGVAQRVVPFGDSLIILVDEMGGLAAWVSADALAWHRTAESIEIPLPAWGVAAALADEERLVVSTFSIVSNYAPHQASAFIVGSDDAADWALVHEEDLVTQTRMLDPAPLGGIVDAIRFGEVLIGVGHVGVYGDADEPVGDESCGPVLSCRTDATVWVGEWRDETDS